MILRSVTKHVKDQNWFAVFLDLLIVVIGVFIGIQVSNWNEQIAGQKQAQVLLKRIHHDLNNDILSMQAELEYQGAVRNYAMTAVDALNGVNAVSDEQFVHKRVAAAEFQRKPECKNRITDNFGVAVPDQENTPLGRHGKQAAD